MVEPDEEGMASAAISAWLSGADLVELRLDCLVGLTGEKIDRLLKGLEPIGIPKVATIMPASIFGRYAGGDRARAGLLARAAERADYVDINKEMGCGTFDECVDRIKGSGAQPVVSWHSPRMLELGEVKEFMSSVKVNAVFKAVMPAARIEDNMAALGACSALSGHRRVVFCHGPLGRISRVLAPFFGSEWTYASLKPGREAAPGQIDLQTMRRAQEAFTG